VWHGARQLHVQQPLAEVIAAEEERRQHTQMLYGRVQSMAVNVHYWKTHAVDKHECRTCRRRFASQAEQEAFLAMQAGPMDWPQTCPAYLYVGTPVHRRAVDRASKLTAGVRMTLTWCQAMSRPCAVAWMDRPWSTSSLCSAWRVWLAWRSVPPTRISSARLGRRKQHRHAGHAGHALPKVRDESEHFAYGVCLPTVMLATLVSTHCTAIGSLCGHVSPCATVHEVTSMPACGSHVSVDMG